MILGHVDSATAGPAIFYRLGTLRAGDTAMVTRADHTVAVFRVDSVEKYAKASFPTLQVFGDTDHAALRLITCGGAFNPSQQSYEDNIVVYAHLASSLVETGNEVEEGEEIAAVGDTGSLKGAFLYFEIRKQGQAIDPAPWLEAD